MKSFKQLCLSARYMTFKIFEMASHAIMFLMDFRMFLLYRQKFAWSTNSLTVLLFCKEQDKSRIRQNVEEILVGINGLWGLSVSQRELEFKVMQKYRKQISCHFAFFLFVPHVNHLGNADYLIITGFRSLLCIQPSDLFTKVDFSSLTFTGCFSWFWY